MSIENYLIDFVSYTKPNIIIMNFNSPKTASAGKVVKKATGKTNVNIRRKGPGYDDIG